jgi:hypothetical protein
MWSLPMGDGSRISSLSPPARYYQEAATLCGVPRWFTHLFAISTDSLLYQGAATLRGVPRWFTYLLSHMSPISTDSLSPRGKTCVFFVHLAKHVKITCQQKKYVSYLHPHARGKTVVFCVHLAKQIIHFSTKIV